MSPATSEISVVWMQTNDATVFAAAVPPEPPIQA
jgi:hypothetical protein